MNRRMVARSGEPGSLHQARIRRRGRRRHKPPRPAASGTITSRLIAAREHTKLVAGYHSSSRRRALSLNIALVKPNQN